MSNNNIPLRIIYFILILALVSLLAFIKSSKDLSHVLSARDSIESDSITIVLGGDVMLGRSVNSRLTRTRDYEWPFRYIGDVFRAADLAYINLESPLTSDCGLTDTGMRLCGDIKNIASLVGAGIDIASLANNHALDYGNSGLKETHDSLLSNDIQASGVGQVIYKEVNGLKFAFVSFNDVGSLGGVDSAADKIIKERLSKARSTANFVIATFHWGREYEGSPTLRQINLAHQTVELGADLVVGTHPHWIQTKETYKGVPIYYSLGNTIFDQEWSEPTKTGLVLKVYIQDSVISKIDELVLYSSNYGQPRWLNK